MAFTDNCDLFGAVHEDGINRFIDHLLRQRPSLFNYATADIAANRELWCTDVQFSEDVARDGDPLFTIMPPLPLLGADAPRVGVGFCAQISAVRIDIHKGNIIDLPPELKPPLAEQRFALQFRLCAGIGCPSPDLVDKIPVRPPRGRENEQKEPPVFLPGRLRCFCFEVFVVGHVERTFIGGREVLIGKVDAMDIVDIKPEALEQNIICYLKTTLNVVLREKLTVAIQTLMLSFPLFGLATVTLAPTGNPPVPHNPALEDDQIKVFVTMTVV